MNTSDLSVASAPFAHDWVATSIMARKGVGHGAAARTHHLTEELQGRYHYTMGPYSEPVLHIEPGDRVIVETRDAFEGAIRHETDKPSELLRMPFLNPQNGPIMVSGAEKGDTIAVYIELMVPRGENPRGTCCMIEEFGGLTGTTYTAMLNDPLPEVVRKINLDETFVHWSDRVKLPYKPHIGTLSCSPEIDSINSLTPDNHGGNMDLPDMGPGSITYLPVRSPGGAGLHRGCPCLPGRRRSLRCRRGIFRDRHHQGGSDQGLEHRLAAPRKRRARDGDRERPAARGRNTHRLPGADPLDGRRLWLRQVGCLHAAQPVWHRASRQFRRSEIFRRRSHSKEDCHGLKQCRGMGCSAPARQTGGSDIFACAGRPLWSRAGHPIAVLAVKRDDARP